MLLGLLDVALELLQQGADTWKVNKNEGTPLYIAALGVHVGVVDMLLSHFPSYGIYCLSSKSYGNGWAPLHATAVAVRCSLARRVLASCPPHVVQLCDT